MIKNSGGTLGKRPLLALRSGFGGEGRRNLCHRYFLPENKNPCSIQKNLDALYMPGFVFNCHIKPGIDKGCECVGFRYAKQYLETLDRG